MAARPTFDPTVLDPSGLTFHQIVSFALDPPPLHDHFDRSPLFEIRRFENAAVAHWVRWTAEHEPSFFPYGRVTLYRHGVLLESFGEGRMRALRDRVDLLSAWQVSCDQLRVFRLPDVLQDPDVLLQPIPEISGVLTRRGSAEMYLRMAWPFFVREDLSRRTPAAWIVTGRGRTALQEVLEKLPEELRREHGSFPDFSHDELRHILLPEEPAPSDAPEEKPHPADDHPRR
jgi:hypothetical protein